MHGEKDENGVLQEVGKVIIGTKEKTKEEFYFDDDERFIQYLRPKGRKSSAFDTDYLEDGSEVGVHAYEDQEKWSKQGDCIHKY